MLRAAELFLKLANGGKNFEDMNEEERHQDLIKLKKWNEFVNRSGNYNLRNNEEDWGPQNDDFFEPDANEDNEEERAAIVNEYSPVEKDKFLQKLLEKDPEYIKEQQRKREGERFQKYLEERRLEKEKYQLQNGSLFNDEGIDLGSTSIEDLEELF